MQTNENLRDVFEKERLEILKSWNEEKIRNFFKKWNPSGGIWEANKEMFWKSVCIGILQMKEAPEELKNKARQWFHERGEKAIEEPEESKSRLILPPGYGNPNSPFKC